MSIENDNLGMAGADFDGDNVTEDQANALGALFLSDDDEPDEDNSPDDDEAVENASDDEAADYDDTDDQDDDQDDDDQDDQDDETSDDVIALTDTSKKVTLPDGTTTTVQELINGNLRHADYTRKRQEAAVAEKAVEAERQQIRQYEQTIAQEREQMAMVLQQFMPAKPDPAMIEDDPIGYQMAKHRYDEAAQAIQGTLQAHQQHMAYQQAQEAQARQQLLQQESERFFEANPEYRDRAAFTEFQQAASSTLSGVYGFTHDEIGSLMDHRMLNVVRDAIAFRKLQNSAPKAKEKVQGKPPVMKSRRKTSQPSNAKFDKRIRDAQRTGDVTSVSDILGELLSKG